MCCALARSNPPYGQDASGFTQDQCLPNGLCLNGATTDAGDRITTYSLGGAVSSTSSSSSETSTSTSSPSSTPSLMVASASVTSASIESASPTASHGSTPSSTGPSGGTIAGIAVGAVVVVALIAAGLFYVLKVRRAKRVGYGAPPAAEFPYIAEAPGQSQNAAFQDMTTVNKHARLTEMPGSLPAELHGDSGGRSYKP
ncbi:hypothetical protein LTR95_005740 [Oleoguttula sp. CCFEE 5521]